MRNYSSVAAEKSLTANVTSVATEITLDSLTGLPSAPYTLVINPDTTIEEIVTVTSVKTGTTLYVDRAQESTSAQNHTSGNKVRHMITGRDLQEPQTHIAATTNIHGLGVSSNVVGTTDTQELTNKTIGSGSSIKSGTSLTNAGTISGGTVSPTTLNTAGASITGGTISGVSLSGSITNGATLSGGTYSNPTITGTTGGITAGNKLVIQSGGSIDVASGGTISFGTVGQITANSLTVSALEIGYLDGVTSSIQTQLNTKAPLASPTFTGTVDTTGATIALGTNATAITANSKTISATELSLLDGLDDTGWVTTGATVGTGFTATYRYRRFMNIVTIFIQATRTGATITNANVAGDITDTTVLTIPTGYYPSAIGSIIWDVATPAGAGNVGVGTISTAGVMKINALNDEDSQIAANDILTALVTYIL